MEKTKEKLIQLYSAMTWKSRWLVVIIFISIIGIGAYAAKDYLMEFMHQKKFLGALFSTESKTILFTEGNPQENHPLKESGNTVSLEKKTCSFKTSEKPQHTPVIFNEISWMGNSESSNNEWIELKNISLKEVSLSGWSVINKDEKIHIVLGESVTIEAGDFYLLERGGANFLKEAKADDFYSGALKNSGDSLRLFDADCHLIDEVMADNSWLAGDNTTKKTMERDAVTLGWHTSSAVNGTPKKENTLFVQDILGITNPSNPEIPPKDTTNVQITPNNQELIPQVLPPTPPTSPTPAPPPTQPTQPTQPTPSALSTPHQLPPPPAPPSIYYNLSVAKSGDGTGSITSDPSGIFCTESCRENSENFISGASITLLATASEGSEFIEWQGGCVSNTTCVLSIDGAKSVTALFTPISLPESPQPPPLSPPTGNAIDHLLISEIMIGMEGVSNYTFLEFYNPTSVPINLTGWTVKKKTSTGTESSLIVADRLEDKIIQPGKYLLAANDEGYTGSVVPDVKYPSSYTLAYSNNAVIVYDNAGQKVEEVSWTLIPKGQSYERDSWSSDNFHLQTAPNPQNSEYP